jgi:predicted enzyme related to lactoylglutathione lyase
LCVADLDLAVAAIAARGITGGPAEIIGDAGRKATFTDAEGNAVSFIEVAASPA